MDLQNYKIKLPMEILNIIDLYNKPIIIDNRRVCEFTIHDNIDGLYKYKKKCTECYYNTINLCNHNKIYNNYFINETIHEKNIIDMDYEYFQCNHTINNIIFYKYIPYHKFELFENNKMLDIIENHYGKLPFFI